MNLGEILLGFSQKGFEMLGRYYSTYRGFVMDNEDPEHCNRIKVKVPNVYGDQIPDKWVSPKGNFFGKQYGYQMLPQRGDIVFITFEYGDPEFPLWEHGYPARGEKPTDLRDVNTYWFKTPQGHTLVLDDTNKLVRITDLTGNILEMNETGISLVRKTDKTLSLGSLNQSSEPAVLGDKNATQQERILKLLEDLQKSLDTYFTAQLVVTASGPLAPLSAAMTQIKAELIPILADIQIGKQGIEPTKSTKTTLD